MGLKSTTGFLEAEAAVVGRLGPSPAPISASIASSTMDLSPQCTPGAQKKKSVWRVCDGHIFQYNTV